MGIVIFGYIAALSTSFCWASSSLLYSFAGKNVSAAYLTQFRLIFAVIFISIIHVFMFGDLLPKDINLSSVILLGLSGISGLVFGDLFMFKAFKLIGTQKTLVIKTATPAVVAFFSYILLNEQINLYKSISIIIIVIGLCIVIYGIKNESIVEKIVSHRDILKGGCFALLCVLGQAGSVMFSKAALVTGIHPISATQIRVIISSIFTLIVVLFFQRSISYFTNTTNPSTISIIAIATLLGSIIGVSLSLYALQTIEAAVASTLMSLAPIFVLIFSQIIEKKKPTLIDYGGTFVTLLGTYFLFLSPN